MDLEGYEVFIDPMVLHGVLASVLLGLAALWLLVLRSALWRAWLYREHRDAIDQACLRLGLRPRRASLTSQVRLVRDTPEGQVLLQLQAAFGQPRAVLRAPLKGRLVRPLESGQDWLADWGQQVLGAAGQL